MAFDKSIVQFKNKNEIKSNWYLYIKLTCPLKYLILCIEKCSAFNCNTVFFSCIFNISKHPESPKIVSSKKSYDLPFISFKMLLIVQLIIFRNCLIIFQYGSWAWCRGIYNIAFIFLNYQHIKFEVNNITKLCKQF